MKQWYLDFNDSTLDNGLRVISIKRDTQIFSIHGGMKVGPFQEEEKEKGLSHFIEHMMFKGTKKRDNETLNNELEFLGGEYNAYTDYSCTVYSISALSEELPKAIELLGDMLINSKFNEEDIEKERGVILSEIKTSKDDIEDLSFKKLYQYAFKNSPLRWDIIGSEKHVKGFTRKDIVDFYKEYYIPNNMCITIVSNYDHDEVLNLIEKNFTNWESKALKKKQVITEKNTEGIFTSYKKDLEQSTLTYLYTLHHIDKSMELALKILNLKLGESSNSILFRELREKMGLAYDVYTHMDLTNNIKTLAIYTAIGEDAIDESMEIIDTCMNNIKNRSIIFDDTTVDLMKKVHKTAVASIMEDSTELCNYVIHQALEEESIYEFIDDMNRLKNITSDHIYEAALKVLNNPTIHILKGK
ncbi:M16 family metallopeptidase [Clostridium hydrogeniformans]|uniref:M16 family metallopeptidase n=1 Tax=Clostridium hydrogeniformans TaxID=349933 RepID=UPI0004805228|nr:pitrilysin family protein [Clostridium hydrogeniformans]